MNENGTAGTKGINRVLRLNTKGQTAFLEN